MNKTKRTEAEQQALLAYLREKYVYEPESGLLRHKKHDRPVRPRVNVNRKYYVLRITMQNRKYTVYLHYAVWALCKGHWPIGTIDHINGNPLDNRIENLRECSQSENQMNMELSWEPNPETGVPGVDKHRRKFRTIIRGKQMLFSSPYEAFFIATLCGKRYRQ
ncbi:MAG: HNH endonuclease [Bacteroidaceae bacterium]|nr:HNH endonuclease [Bacteroidaceae bacterium]